MNLKERILETCDKKIAVMQNSVTPQRVKEELLEEKQIIKEVLKIVCDTQGITLSAAIQILNGSIEIIKEVAFGQII